jgi:uncharacterized protein YggU (UPF0235/DUF167 family)
VAVAVAGELPWRPVARGLLVAIRLTPRGGRDALGAVEILADGKAVLTARVRAAPTEGEANQALTRLMAKTLKVPPSRVSIAQGASSRIKTVLIEADGEALQRILTALAEAVKQEHRSPQRR